MNNFLVLFKKSKILFSHNFRKKWYDLPTGQHFWLHVDSGSCVDNLRTQEPQTTKDVLDQ